MGATHRLVNTGTRTDDIRASKLLIYNAKHTLQVLPIPDVRLLEDRSSGGLRAVGMTGHELLSFGAKGQVGEEDVALFGEESTREGEVDA